MATPKNKPKIVVCPVKPTPPHPAKGPKLAPSPEGAPELTVLEAALNKGSAPADTGEMAQTLPNAVTFTAGTSKIQSIKFGGTGGIQVLGAVPGTTITWAVSNSGHTLTGTVNGLAAIILTITGPTTANAGHSVSPTVAVKLTDNFPHQNGAVDGVDQPGVHVDLSGVHLIATDLNNKHATADVKVHVVDDVPTAVADTDSIPAATFGPATGNVITDAEGDGGKDTPGADGVTVVGVDDGNTGVDLDGVGVGVAIQGQYGKLTLGSDGSYSYVRDANTPGGHDDVFTYTIKDGDGDLAHTTLTISIGDAPPEITNLTPEAQGGDTSVDEDDLLASRGAGESAGSDTSKESTTQGGDFTINSPDGVKSLKIGGVEVIANEVFTATDITTPLGNILHIISYVPATGVINYGYELVDNESHPLANGQNSIFENFTVDLVDQDNDPASGTLAVKIVDDVPTAANDGIFQVTQGTPFEIDALANDIFGADGVDTDNDPAVAVSVTTGPSQGTATYDATTGKFTYTSNGSASGSDSFTYTIVDRDGDSSTATVTVDVKGDDSHAQAGQTSALVDEDDLPAGNHDAASGDDAPTAQPGLLPHNYGSDGAGTTKFIAGVETVNGVHYTYSVSPDGLVLTAHDDVNNIDVFKATLSNDVDGSYTVQLLAPIDHPIANTEDNLDFHLTYAVLDSDDVAPVNGSLTLTIDDDSPIVSRADVAADPLTVDETNLALNATANFADNFTSSYGADGAGTTTYALNVSAAGVDSGLDDTATGSNILLFKEGSTVVGRVGNAAGPISFIVSVDAAGTVTLDQQRAIFHTPDSGPDQDATLSAANLVSLTATITDKDGDTASAPINIGTSLHFHDDAPSISVSAAADPLTVDETNLALNATANFADNFTSSYGADGAGTTTYALNVSAAGVDSGLDDTATGSNILLFKEGSTVVGRVGNAAGPISFIVSVDAAGTVTLDQQRAIFHTPDSGPDQDATLSAANLVSLTATITDKDGDTASAPINIGTSLHFHDDAPSISVSAAADPLTVDETNLALNATANFADNFTSSYGADGAGTTTYALNVSAAGVDSGLDDTATGSNILLFKEGSTVVGRVGNAAGPISFIVSVDAAGTVTLDQQRAIFHTPDSGPDQDATLSAANLVSLTATITDKDGDTASAPINIGTSLHFHDDAPSAANITKTIDEGARDTNLSLILDVSGSMDDPSGLTGLTRLDVLKASVIELFEQYDNVGDVRVQLVSFSTGATQVGSDWMTLATAKAFVQNLSAGGSTNYDAALTQLQTIYGDPGKLATPGVQSVAYFVSDGQPNLPAGSEGISAGEETNWTNFLNANSINSFALGAGSGVTQSALDPAAYNGQTHVNTNSIVVTDLGQLAVTLTGTVNAVTGNLLTDGPASFGADGGHVKSVTANGSTYTYNPATDAITVAGTDHGSFNSATNVLTIALANGGSFVIDIDDGSYSYTAPPVVNANISEPIGFTLTDNDGDTASATLTVNVNNADLAPIVHDDLVITNITGSSASIVIPDYALLYNDVDPDGQTVAVTSAGSANDGTIVDNAADITFTDDGDGNGGNFTYTGTAGALSDTGLVTINRAQAGETTLDGTGLNNILIGTSGAETLVGNEGRDVLIGGAGNDTFDFNATVDSPSLAKADLIGDFEGDGALVGDLINLQDIDANTLSGGNQAFAFVAAQNAGVVANSVTWSQSGGNTIVQADVNGDTTADLVIVLRGLHALTAADFVL